MVIAFGYSKGGPPKRADKVFDVRDLTHAERSDEFQNKAKDIIAYGRSHPGETLGIGCEKGQHRSVVLARLVSRALRTSVSFRDR